MKKQPLNQDPRVNVNKAKEVRGGHREPGKHLWEAFRQLGMQYFRGNENSPGIDGKESACNAGGLGSILGLGRSPGEGNGNPLQYSCLENLHGQRSLVGYSPWGHKESDTTEWLTLLLLYNIKGRDLVWGWGHAVCEACLAWPCCHVKNFDFKPRGVGNLWFILNKG